MSPRSGDDFDHPWLVERMPDEVLDRYRKAMFLVRSSNEPLVILDSLTEMKEALRRLSELRSRRLVRKALPGSQVAEALQP